MSTLNHYRIFVAVIETGSITQAALKLNLSAPAISKQLMQLEQSVQVQLFHRSHKKLEVTEAGKRFYPKCKSILAAVNKAEDELLKEDDAVKGTIAITLSKALARSKIFAVLASFTAKYPNIQFDIRFSDNFSDLHHENIDFAFRLGALQDSSHMIAKPLIETQLLACASREYLDQHGTPNRFTDLGTGRLILLSPLNNSAALKKFFHKENINPDNCLAHLCSDIEAVHQAVKAGLGIGFLLDIAVEQEIEEGTFFSVLAERSLPKKRLYLLYKKNQWQSQKLLAFKTHIQSLLSDEIQ